MTTETDRHYNIGFDATLRVAVRVETDAPESPVDIAALAAEWVKKALTEARLGAVPVGGIDPHLPFTVNITEATMNDEPELFELNGVEVGEDDFCSSCGEVESGFGDGWDGECPSCADRTYAKSPEGMADALTDGEHDG